MMPRELYLLAEKVGKALQAKNLCLVTAESCTGGWVAEAITAVAGSSQWFERGFVTYSNEAKHEMLGVTIHALAHHGAVSEVVAREMAEGALTRSHGNVSIAITGIAGPAGGSADKPVGTVWIAWAGKSFVTQTQLCLFKGDREAIRLQAVKYSLEGLLKILM